MREQAVRLQASRMTAHLRCGASGTVPVPQSCAKAGLSRFSRWAAVKTVAVAVAVAAGEDSICNVSCSSENVTRGRVDHRVYATVLPSLCLRMPVPPIRHMCCYAIPVPRGLCRSTSTRLALGSTVVAALSSSLCCESYSPTPRVSCLQVLQTGSRSKMQEQAVCLQASRMTAHLRCGASGTVPVPQSRAKAGLSRFSRWAAVKTVAVAVAVAAGEDSICNVSCSSENVTRGRVDHRVYATVLPSLCLRMPVPPIRRMCCYSSPVPRGLCRSTSTRLALGSTVVAALSGSLCCESYSPTPRVSCLQVLQTGSRSKMREQAVRLQASRMTAHLRCGASGTVPVPQSFARAGLSRLSRRAAVRTVAVAAAVAAGEDSICNVSCSSENVTRGRVDHRVYATVLPSLCLRMPVPPSRRMCCYAIPVPRGLCRSTSTRLALGSTVVAALSGSFCCESYSPTPRVSCLQVLQTGSRGKMQEQAVRLQASGMTAHLRCGASGTVPVPQSFARAGLSRFSRRAAVRTVAVAAAVAAGEDSICNVSCSSENVTRGRVDHRVYATILPVNHKGWRGRV